MANVIETVAAERWILDMLEANTALVALVGTKIFSYLVPKNTVAPYVVFEFDPPGEDELGIGGTRILSTLPYRVIAVGQTKTFASLEAIAKEIDVALHAKSGPVTGGGFVNECIRISPLAEVEPVDGLKEFRHLGGIYQLRVSM